MTISARAELPKIMCAIDMHQPRLEPKKVVDKLIYPLLNGSFRTL
jgi:hypothetical protein